MIQEHIFVLTKIAKIILLIQIPVGDNCYYVWIVTSHGHKIANDFCHYKNAVLLLLYYSVSSIRIIEHKDRQTLARRIKFNVI